MIPNVFLLKTRVVPGDGPYLEAHVGAGGGGNVENHMVGPYSTVLMEWVIFWGNEPKQFSNCKENTYNVN